MITLSCPACGFSKEIPADRIPSGKKRVACPKCRETFALPEAEVSVAPAGDRPEPTPQPGVQQPSVEDQPSLTAAPPVDDGQLNIVCPHCNVRRKLPREKVPSRTVQVTCPKCSKSFTFHGEQVHREETLVRPELHPVLAASVPGAATPDAPRRQSLSNVGDLLGKSWQTFVRRIFCLIGIGLLVLCLSGIGVWVLTALGQRVGQFSEGRALVQAGFAALTATYVFVMLTWSGAASIYALIDEDLGMLPALGAGLQRLGPFLWVYLLIWFMVAGGSLLLVLPGMLFAFWFLFAPFILAWEDLRGMEALLKSKAYLEGFGWAVLGRVLLAGLVVSVVSGVLSVIPVLGALASGLLGLYLMACYVELFKELVEIKGDISFDCSRGAKLRWPLVAAGGFILGLVVVFTAGIV